MKKYTAAARALLKAASGAWAKTLTPAEALARLETSSAKQKAPSRLRTQSRLAHTTMTPQGAPAVYIFAGNDGKGYLAVSADDCTEALLGYSDNATVDGTISPELEWWLSQYADQIDYINAQVAKGNILRYSTNKAAEREAIAPMIKTQWDQGAPYNAKCPTVGTTRTYTGCVATALAQMMNYWQYPAKGQGRVTYQWATGGKKLSLNMATITFDWDNMLDTYVPGNYNEAQELAVANLMKACGYAVEMDYGTDSSGALAMNVGKALATYFNYDGNIDYQLRQYYSRDEWEELLYNNLKEVGPIMYGGGSYIGGGHSFICDGYKDGYFHFNWGWTGMSDGYFQIDALNPYALGTGGGGGGGYNFTQDAVLGIQPPTGEPVVEKPLELTQCGSLYGEVVADSLKFDLFVEASASWVNYNPEDLSVKLGAIFEPINGTAGSKFEQETYSTLTFKETVGDATKYVVKDTVMVVDLAAGYGIPASTYAPKINIKKLADAGKIVDGKYKVTMAWYNEATKEWRAVKPNYSYYNYVTLTKKGSEYTVDYEEVNRLTITSAKISELYYGCVAQVEFTVKNFSDQQLTSGFAPCLGLTSTGQMAMLGESVAVTLNPGEEQTYSITTTMYALTNQLDTSSDTEMFFTFFDEMTYNAFLEDVDQDVIMHAAPAAPRLTASGAPVIKGAAVKKESVAGQDVDVFQVTDTREIMVEGDITLSEGVFAYEFFAVVAVPSTQGLALINYVGGPLVMNLGETRHFEANIATNVYNAETLYYLSFGMAYRNQLYQIDENMSYFRIIETGVEDVAAEHGLSYDGRMISALDTAIEIFNLNGQKVAEGFDAYDASTLAKGVYLVRAAGKTLKIAVK